MGIGRLGVLDWNHFFGGILMIGAILGDIIGSRFEFHNYLSKDFTLLTPRCEFTDDTVMTCAVA